MGTALQCKRRAGLVLGAVTAGSRGKLCLQLHECMRVLFLLRLLPAPWHVPTARSPLGGGRFSLLNLTGCFYREVL